MDLEDICLQRYQSMICENQLMARKNQWMDDEINDLKRENEKLRYQCVRLREKTEKYESEVEDKPILERNNQLLKDKLCGKENELRMKEKELIKLRFEMKPWAEKIIEAQDYAKRVTLENDQLKLESKKNYEEHLKQTESFQKEIDRSKKCLELTLARHLSTVSSHTAEINKYAERMKDMEQLKNQITEKDREIEKHVEQIRDLEKKLNDMEETLGKAEGRVNETEEALRQAEGRTKATEEKLVEAQNATSIAEKKLKATENAIMIAKNNFDAEAKGLEEAMNAETARLDGNVSKLEADLENAKREIEKTSSVARENRVLRATIDDLIVTKKDLLEQIDGLNNEIRALKEEIKNLPMVVDESTDTGDLEPCLGSAGCQTDVTIEQLCRAQSDHDRVLREFQKLALDKANSERLSKEEKAALQFEIEMLRTKYNCHIQRLEKEVEDAITGEKVAQACSRERKREIDNHISRELELRRQIAGLDNDKRCKAEEISELQCKIQGLCRKLWRERNNYEVPKREPLLKYHKPEEKPDGKPDGEPDGEPDKKPNEIQCEDKVREDGTTYNTCDEVSSKTLVLEKKSTTQSEKDLRKCMKEEARAKKRKHAINDKSIRLLMSLMPCQYCSRSNKLCPNTIKAMKDAAKAATSKPIPKMEDRRREAYDKHLNRHCPKNEDE